MKKCPLIIGIIFLFILSSVTPTVIGYRVENTQDDSELDKQLDNLRFICTGSYGLDEQKYNYYKEKLLAGYSSENIRDDTIFELEKEGFINPLDLLSVAMVGGTMDSAWPMKCHDLHHTSQSPCSTAHITDLEKWRFRCDGVDGSPIIGNDGTIYFGDKDRDIYALHPNGVLKWKYHTGGWITSAPALAEDGTIYVGSWDSCLYAFYSNGTRKWKVGTGASIFSSPAIGKDGTIYIGTLDPGNSIVAVNPNGTIKWKYKTGWIMSSPAIGDDETIYIGSTDNYRFFRQFVTGFDTRFKYY